MISDKRTTIYFDAEIHRALRVKAALLDVSISDVVNRAVKQLLAEDLEDISAFDERKDEPNLDFEDVVKALRESGKI
jgi:hypothetical protein